MPDLDGDWPLGSDMQKGRALQDDLEKGIDTYA